jgi:predicted esterase
LRQELKHQQRSGKYSITIRCQVIFKQQNENIDTRSNRPHGPAIAYPRIGSTSRSEIERKISDTKNDVFIGGHSFGASMILKYLFENSVNKNIKSIFLIATPFWSGNEDWEIGLKLQGNFGDKLPNEVPIFFYHCQDDEEIPFSHFNQYKQKVMQATFREIRTGGHQLNNDLTLVANDIKSC